MKLEKIRAAKEQYARGENVIKFLRQEDEQNSINDIAISYDLQAGSYVKHYYANQVFKQQYNGELVNIIKQMGTVHSLLEVGVGEATTLKDVCLGLGTPPQVMGFDISWSRLKFGEQFLLEHSLPEVQLFLADLFNIPLPDDSVDVVYTSHSLEPNGGREREALTELYRVTKKYLVLLEPAFDLAGAAARTRMTKNGYVTRLMETITDLKYSVQRHELFKYSVNELNPTGLTIIKKDASTENATEPILHCPITYTPLKKVNSSLLYSTNSSLAYPIVQNIPCLRRENAVLATHLETDFQSFIQKNKKALWSKSQRLFRSVAAIF